MADYKSSPGIIIRSLDELKIIHSWVEEQNINSGKPGVILIGGWAVDSYNSWYGSVDIDLVTTSDIRNDLKYFL